MRMYIVPQLNVTIFLDDNFMHKLYTNGYLIIYFCDTCAHLNVLFIPVI